MIWGVGAAGLLPTGTDGIGADSSNHGLLGWMDKKDGWTARGAFIFRQIIARVSDVGEKKTATGWGLTVGGGIPISWWTEKGRLFWQFTYGEGIGRYINDLGTIGGQDAIFSPEGDLKVLPVFAGYVSFQHWWTPRWRSNTMLSWVDVNTYDFQELPSYIAQFGDPYKSTLRGSVNLLYNPIQRVELGAELLWGERRNANDTVGSATQIQLSVRYLC